MFLHWHCLLVKDLWMSQKWTFQNYLSLEVVHIFCLNCCKLNLTVEQQSLSELGKCVWWTSSWFSPPCTGHTSDDNIVSCSLCRVLQQQMRKDPRFMIIITVFNTHLDLIVVWQEEMQSILCCSPPRTDCDQTWAGWDWLKTTFSVCDHTWAGWGAELWLRCWPAPGSSSPSWSSQIWCCLRDWKTWSSDEMFEQEVDLLEDFYPELLWSFLFLQIKEVKRLRLNQNSLLSWKIFLAASGTMFHQSSSMSWLSSCSS